MTIAKNPWQVGRDIGLCRRIVGKEQPLPEPGKLYCPTVTDTILCWPSTEAGTNASRPCPIFRGLDPSKEVKKFCDVNGHWAGGEHFKVKREWGYTDYRAHCMLSVFKNINRDSLSNLQKIVNVARYMEFAGLSISLISLVASLIIFATIRRLRNFRNHLHIQLIMALLITVVVRFTLYIDTAVSKSEKNSNGSSSSGIATIDSITNICVGMYVLLEYAKTVAYLWMILEGFYLHNALIVQVFSSEPKLHRYIMIGWGVPVIHVSIWFFVLFFTDRAEHCLLNYFLQPEYWILDSVRLMELLINLVFLLNIVRVVWMRVRETHPATQADRKSIKAALMLIPLLGIPNIMQVIPLYPPLISEMWFEVYTYIATISYMFQGFFVCLLYCFTNKEVVNALKAHYQRYRIRTASSASLRRGSRLPTNYGLSEYGHNAANGYSQDLDMHNRILSAFTEAQSVPKHRQSPIFLDKSIKVDDDHVTKELFSKQFGYINEVTCPTAPCETYARKNSHTASSDFSSTQSPQTKCGDSSIAESEPLMSGREQKDLSQYPHSVRS